MDADSVKTSAEDAHRLIEKLRGLAT